MCYPVAILEVIKTYITLRLPITKRGIFNYKLQMKVKRCKTHSLSSNIEVANALLKVVAMKILILDTTAFSLFKAPVS